MRMLSHNLQLYAAGSAPLQHGALIIVEGWYMHADMCTGQQQQAGYAEGGSLAHRVAWWPR